MALIYLEKYLKFRKRFQTRKYKDNIFNKKKKQR